MKHKHRWHFAEFNEVKNEDFYRIIAVFICDRCGCFKETFLKSKIYQCKNGKLTKK